MSHVSHVRFVFCLAILPHLPRSSKPLLLTPVDPWHLLAGIGNSFALETAPMGFGVELNPFGLAAAIGQAFD